MKKLVSILLALAMVLSLFVGYGASAYAESEEKVVTMGVIAPWMTLCHMMWPTKDQQQVFTAPMYDSAVAIDGTTGEIEPRVFDSWTASEDNMTITVKINPNITWHDGEKLTAEDVVYTCNLVTSPDFETERVSNLQYVVGMEPDATCNDFSAAGIRAVDDYTVEFSLTIPMDPDSFIGSGFYRFYVAPEHLLGDVPMSEVSTNELWENPVGYGPFKFDSYIDGERFEYVKNENYYRGVAQFDRLIIKVIDASAMLSALKSGDVDMTAFPSVLSVTDLDMAAEDENLNVIVNDGYSHDHLLINNKRFTSEQRNALNYLINKEILAQAAYGNYAKPTTAMFNKNHPYYNPIVESMAYEYDPEKGVQLLQEAGFDFDKTYTIHVQSDSTQRIVATTALQQMFAEAGINCEIVQADMATISAALNGNECDFAMMGSAGTPFDPLNELFYYWVDGWNQMTDPQMEEWGAEINAALTFEEKYAISEKMQVYQMENTPMIYLYLKDQTYVISDRISGADAPSFATKNWNYCEWEVA